MKGVIFIFLIYFFTLVLTALIKFARIKLFKKKEVEEKPSTPKIYYIKNGGNPKKPQKVDIAIKGRIVDKED